MTYVVITAVVLLFLNLYCSKLSQDMVHRNKERTLIEKCHLASDEIASLEVVNTATVSAILSQLDSLSSTRLIVTDQTGIALYDSLGAANNT